MPLKTKKPAEADARKIEEAYHLLEAVQAQYEKDRCLSEALIKMIALKMEKRTFINLSGGIPDPFVMTGVSETDADGNDIYIRCWLTRELLYMAAREDDEDTFRKVLGQASFQVGFFRFLPWRDTQPGYSGFGSLCIPNSYAIETYSAVIGYCEACMQPNGKEADVFISGNRSYLDLIKKHDRRKTLFSQNLSGIIRLGEKMGVFFHSGTEKAAGALLAAIRRNIELVRYFQAGTDRAAGWNLVPVCVIWIILPGRKAVHGWACEVSGSVPEVFLTWPCFCSNTGEHALAQEGREFADLHFRTLFLSAAVSDDERKDMILKAETDTIRLFAAHRKEKDIIGSQELKTVLQSGNPDLLREWTTLHVDGYREIEQKLMRCKTILPLFCGSSQIAAVTPAAALKRTELFLSSLFEIAHTEKTKNKVRLMAAKVLLSESEAGISGDGMLLRGFLRRTGDTGKTKRSRQLIERQEAKEQADILKHILQKYLPVQDYSVYMDVRSAADIIRLFEMLSDDAPDKKPFPVDFYKAGLKGLDALSAVHFPSGVLVTDEGTNLKEFLKEITGLIRPIRIRSERDPINELLINTGTISQLKKAIQEGWITDVNAGAFLETVPDGKTKREKMILLMGLCPGGRRLADEMAL